VQEPVGTDQIDGVVVGGQAREMAMAFHFADFGKILRFPLRVFCAPRAAAGSTARNGPARATDSTFPGELFSKISGSF